MANLFSAPRPSTPVIQQPPAPPPAPPPAAPVVTPTPAPTPVVTPAPAREPDPPPWWVTYSPPAPTYEPAPVVSAPAVVTTPTTPATPAPDPEKVAEEAVQKRTRSRIGTVATSWRGVLNPDTAVPGRKRLLGE